MPMEVARARPGWSSCDSYLEYTICFVILLPVSPAVRYARHTGMSALEPSAPRKTRLWLDMRRGNSCLDCHMGHARSRFHRFLLLALEGSHAPSKLNLGFGYFSSITMSTVFEGVQWDMAFGLSHRSGPINSTLSRVGLFMITDTIDGICRRMNS